MCTSDLAPLDDDGAMTVLIAEHRTALMAYAVNLTAGDRAWAEDVVQEAFFRAWRNLDRMTPAHGSVRSWLYRVAHNLAVDGHRARRARPVEVDQVEARIDPAQDASADVLNSIEVREALAELTIQHRDVLVEVYLRDRSLDEAARQLSVPVGTVKSRVFYALRQLRLNLSVEA